jgi:hypothetical protein
MIAIPKGVSDVNRLAISVHGKISRNEHTAFTASESRGHKVTKGMFFGRGGRLGTIAV